MACCCNLINSPFAGGYLAQISKIYQYLSICEYSDDFGQITKIDVNQTSSGKFYISESGWYSLNVGSNGTNIDDVNNTALYCAVGTANTIVYLTPDDLIEFTLGDEPTITVKGVTHTIVKRTKTTGEVLSSNSDGSPSSFIIYKHKINTEPPQLRTETNEFKGYFKNALTNIVGNDKANAFFSNGEFSQLNYKANGYEPINIDGKGVKNFYGVKLNLTPGNYYALYSGNDTGGIIVDGVKYAWGYVKEYKDGSRTVRPYIGDKAYDRGNIGYAGVNSNKFYINGGEIQLVGFVQDSYGNDGSLGFLLLDEQGNIVFNPFKNLDKIDVFGASESVVTLKQCIK